MISARRWAVVLVLGCLACGNGGGFPVDAGPDAAPPGGKFSLAWTLADSSSQPITCSQVGSQVLTVVLRNRAVQGALTEVFSCSSASGVSSAFAPGIYDISFELNGVSGLLTTATTQSGVEIKSNETTALLPIAFEVNAIGALQLRVLSNQPAGNCASTVSMGAGITSTTIALVHTGGACEPVTFDVALGATQPAGTYTVDCATPVIAGCIDNDQTLSVPSLPSGNYQIHIRGTIGGTDCWNNDDSLVVPPKGATLNTNLNLAKQAGC